MKSSQEVPERYQNLDLKWKVEPKQLLVLEVSLCLKQEEKVSWRDAPYLPQ
jgi:hypothetical protein